MSKIIIMGLVEQKNNLKSIFNLKRINKQKRDNIHCLLWDFYE